MSRPRAVVHLAHRKTPQYVYRLRDSAGRLLYVGTTWDVSARLAQHRREHALWWAAVDAVETEAYPDRAAAEAAEKAAIATERPALNVLHAAERAALQAAGVALHMVAVETEPWVAGLRIAQVRSESLNDVIRAAVGEYADRHRHLLVEQDEDRAAQ